MVDFPINNGIRKIASNSHVVPVGKLVDVEWFAEDITILLTSTNVLGTIVVDFSFSVSAIMEYTLDSGTTWVAFNNGLAVTGGQSRFIDVTTGNLVNFRSKVGGQLNRCVVSSVP